VSDHLPFCFFLAHFAMASDQCFEQKLLPARVTLRSSAYKDEYPPIIRLTRNPPEVPIPGQTSLRCSRTRLRCRPQYLVTPQLGQDCPALTASHHFHQAMSPPEPGRRSPPSRSRRWTQPMVSRKTSRPDADSSSRDGSTAVRKRSVSGTEPRSAKTRPPAVLRKSRPTDSFGWMKTN